MKNIGNFYRLFTILYIPLAILVNLTAEINPLIFPILKNGTVELLSNGKHITYNDGSGGFYGNGSNEPNNSSVLKKELLSKGDKLDVTGVRVRHPDFSEEVYIVTSIGEFYNDKDIKTNRTIHALWAEKLSLLMLWPIVPLVLLDLFKKLVL